LLRTATDIHPVYSHAFLLLSTLLAKHVNAFTNNNFFDKNLTDAGAIYALAFTALVFTLQLSGFIVREFCCENASTFYYWLCAVSAVRLCSAAF
jgi:hypothetical protein